MPEGHTIHRHARLQRDILGGSRVRAWSPQGRFSAGAERLDGRRLDDIEAVGKHLFYRWEGGETLHVHLGLFGKFKTFHLDPPAPTEATRLAMANGRSVIYLAGPTICELIDPQAEDRLRSRLGPDPLGPHRERLPGGSALQAGHRPASARRSVGSRPGPGALVGDRCGAAPGRARRQDRHRCPY